MALLRLNPSVPAISGAVGSLVFAKGRTTTTLRLAPPRTVRDSSPNLSRLAQAQTLASAWTAFSDETHRAWRDYANRQLKTNRVDLQSRPSGFGAYMSVALSFTSAVKLENPLPPSIQPLDEIPTVTPSADASTPQVLLEPDFNVISETFLQVSFARTFSKSALTHVRRWVRMPDREVDFPIGDQDYTSDFESRLGSLLPDEYLWVRVRLQYGPSPPGPSFLGAGSSPGPYFTTQFQTA